MIRNAISRNRLKWLALLLSPTLTLSAAEAVREEAGSVAFFEKKVRPVLVNNCYNCHSADTKAAGGLRVDDRNGLLTGGSGGPAIVPGSPDESLILDAITHADGASKMPPKKKLNDAEIADIRSWIEAGAAWPAEKIEEVKSSGYEEKYAKLRKEHWAWQPSIRPAPPSVRNSAWVKDDIDRFVLSGLEKAGLEPVGDAERSDLIRRLTFDLTGLPPTPEEVSAFVGDRSADAFEKVVDRLLASPAFGEHWGRHWLDVSRYGESTGSSRNLPLPHAWRYRDYVIDAVNADKPFDAFIREQIAGDLLPASSDADRKENLIATGFLAIGVKDVNQRFKVRFDMDNVDEQIDTFSRAFLATTVSCARCHDHKFDPIPTKDYYALAGIFTSTDLNAGLRNKMGGGGLDYYDTQRLIVLDKSAKTQGVSPEKREQLTKEVATLKAEFERVRDSEEASQKAPDGRTKLVVARQAFRKKQAELATLNDPAANGAAIAFGVSDKPKPADTAIRLRGEAEKHGAIVPRGFLTTFEVPGSKPVDPAGSGRKELADWIADPANPLTARVAVNRVWSHLFGAGIVRSVDNFGITGDKPSHPELLDHLAHRFVSDGWSTKKLVRAIVLSHAYQLSAEESSSNFEADPENRLVWRHSPRRLQAEAIRDGILAAAGKLDNRRPDGSPARTLEVSELPNNGPKARELRQIARDSTARSVYLPMVRGVVPETLEAFDFVEQGMVTGSRSVTTVPTQALFMLNDPFVRQSAKEVANRIAVKSSTDPKRQVETGYSLVLGRSPSKDEIERGESFLKSFATAWNAIPQSETPAPETTIAKVAPAKPAAQATVPVNPDEIITQDVPAADVKIQYTGADDAALAHFVQALFASAEFRYVR
jgi:mono/diheme cytochrome c family protein